MQTTTSIGSPALSRREITFRHEMLGWTGATHFVLDPLTDESGGPGNPPGFGEPGDPPGFGEPGGSGEHGAAGWLFAALRCTDSVRLRSGAVVPGPTFLVAPPGCFAPRYQVCLDEPFADSLDLVVPDDAALLAIVTQRHPLERSTVNLFSPIVVNRHTGLADQFVPASSEAEAGWSVRTPLPGSLLVDHGDEGDPTC